MAITRLMWASESQSSTVDAFDSRVITRSGLSKTSRKISCTSACRLSMNGLQNSDVAAAGRVGCKVKRPDGCSGRIVFGYQQEAELLIVFGDHPILGCGQVVPDHRLDLPRFCSLDQGVEHGDLHLALQHAATHQ